MTDRRRRRRRWARSCWDGVGNVWRVEGVKSFIVCGFCYAALHCIAWRCGLESFDRVGRFIVYIPSRYLSLSSSLFVYGFLYFREAVLSVECACWLARWRFLRGDNLSGIFGV
jgi:hypothetical protein